MTQRGFRTILIAHISTLTLGTAAGVAYPYLLPPSLLQTYDALEATHADGWVALAIVLLLIGMLTGYVGLFLWRSWGRSLSLAITIIGFVLYPFLGPVIASWPESALVELSTLFWGAVLALAYFSPVSSRFGANNSFKPKPLRGSA